MWGENPDWLWHQPGFPVRYWLKRGNQKSPAAQKGQTKRAAPHTYMHAYTLGGLKARST